MSLLLRHKPEIAGLTLDENGWCNVQSLLEGINKPKSLSDPSLQVVTLADIQQVVANDEKGRYSFSEDGLRIRANQGHSIRVDLNLEKRQPPEILYHGTVDRFLDSIRVEGLRKMDRHHVHLSEQENTAKSVGERRGRAVILRIMASKMTKDGFDFFVSENGVWLVDSVPPKYIKDI